MTKQSTVLITAVLVAMFAPTPVARADIYQWEYVNPTNPSWGKQQSTMLTPDGAGVNAVPAANLSNLNLTKAFLAGAFLCNSNLNSATLIDADFSTGSIDFFYVSQGLTTNLTGANLSQANLTGANFSGFEQYGPEGEYYPYLGASLEGANLRGADTRGANFYLATWNGANTGNLILPHGHIAGLDLTAAASLTIRDFDGNAFVAPIVVDQHLSMDATGRLQMEFDADAWDSTISFAPGIQVALGGTLDLAFAAGVDPATQLGRRIDLFDWTGVAPTGLFNVSSPYVWNLSNLYATGEVTLTAVPGAVLGDFNGNGVVDVADYVVWRDNYGRQSGAMSSSADADRDGDVDGADYLVWQRQFGSIAPAASANAAVPEPATMLLMMFATAGWRFRRWRKA